MNKFNRLSKDKESQIHDGEDHYWFCELHNRSAEMQPIIGWGSTGEYWICPECNEYIETIWEENEKDD